MKTIKRILAILFFAMLPCILQAQQPLTDTLPESAYSFKVPTHVVNIYSNFVPFVLFGIITLGMAYIVYRYWSDNRPTHHDFTHHNLEH